MPLRTYQSFVEYFIIVAIGEDDWMLIFQFPVDNEIADAVGVIDHNFLFALFPGCGYLALAFCHPTETANVCKLHAIIPSIHYRSNSWLW